MRTSVFGLGYVGCVTAACLARAGHEVVGVDINADKVGLINAGASPVVEPGLGDLIAQTVRDGRLRATASAHDALGASDLALLCVGTPGHSSGRLDVTAVARVADEIGQALAHAPKPYTVVLRSTVLPGTTEQVLIPALRAAGQAAHARLDMAVNPEFMREGSSIRDFAAPPLTLIGSNEAATGALVASLYAGVDAPVVHTSLRTAEMVKYVSNAFHALKVAFANEVGDLCSALGADAHDVMRVFRMDHRLNISEAYLRPGFAFGGSCLPKDLRALLHAARGADLGVPLLASILPSNDAQIAQAVDRVLATRRRRIGVVGLAFKPGTDDLRESPMVRLVEMLIGKGCDLRILDPGVALARLGGANRRYIEEEIPHIASLMCNDLEVLLGHAEVVVLGNDGDDARQARGSLREHHLLLDLTRTATEPAP